jgi:hypothetical protein
MERCILPTFALHMNFYSHTIFDIAANLPEQWDHVANGNTFLQRSYLAVLEKAAPKYMACRFIAVFKNGQLEGIGVVQFIDFSSIQTFGSRDNKLKNGIRTFFFKLFSSRVLFVGNNMLTGENTFSKKQDPDWLQEFAIAIHDLEKVFSPHLTIWKDFYFDNALSLKNKPIRNAYLFSAQPNMILEISKDWHTAADYINQFTKKYRDQYKRARKKAMGVEKISLSFTDLVAHEKEIYELYLNVAQKAPFNTFFLPENHFSIMKKEMGDQILINGYFLNKKLIGFSTMILNGPYADTYFLGYHEHYQKEHMLYLNMLYDMIETAINIKSKKIVLARTAMEIKSSVGALPYEMFGFMKHRNFLLNRLLPILFNFFEPKQRWQQRHPFKN